VTDVVRLGGEQLTDIRKGPAAIVIAGRWIVDRF
jgi:hypothetical protein